jgi:hypothetical protein
MLFVETIMEINGRYSICKTKASPHSLVYIIKQEHPLKVDSIINIVQIIVIVDRLSSDSTIRMLAPSLLPIIIAVRSIILMAMTT